MKIYIYSLSDPVTNEVRYIGKTGNIKNRYNAHLAASKRIQTRIGHWIKSLLSRDVLPKLLIVEECSDKNWKEREIFWIAHYRQLGYNLVNYSKGGNEPPQIKLHVRKYSRSKNKYRARASYNNKVYYLGTYNTIEEAKNTYDKFQKDPISYLNQLNPIFNKSGVNMYKDNILVKSFDSVIKCANYLNTSGTNISRCCRGKAITHKGYTFKYQSAEE